MYQIGVYVYRSKAYLPVQARFNSGIWTDLEPVFESELHPDELTEAFKRVIDTGHPILSSPTKIEWQKRKDPILTATKAKNWKSLAQNGASYSISKRGDEIEVYMSYTDKKGRWQYDGRKTKKYPKDVLLRDIAKVIIDDALTRPEIFE